jgi:hypothetical protein
MRQIQATAVLLAGLFAAAPAHGAPLLAALPKTAIR